jgi:C1A family cysteine protease
MELQVSSWIQAQRGSAERGSMKKQKLKVKGFGWRPDIPDGRDLILSAPRGPNEQLPLPPRVDLRNSAMPPIWNQGNLGSCVGHAVAGMYEYLLATRGQKFNFMPSRLFIYYGAREIEGTTAIDEGCYIRDAMKVLANLGVPHESNWKYVLGKFATKPSKAAYKYAQAHQALEYRRVPQQLDQLKGSLAANQPIVFGFAVYESFDSEETDRSGAMPMPAPTEQMYGGHAVMLVGYDDAQQRFIVRNSWGEDWGASGYVTMPYEFVTNNNYCDDFWTLTKVELVRA